MRFSSCVHLLDFRQRSLVNYELACVEDVVGRQDGSNGSLDAGDIASALNDVLVDVLSDDKSLAFDLNAAEEGLKSLCLDFVKLQVVDNNDLAVSRLRERS